VSDDLIPRLPPFFKDVDEAANLIGNAMLSEPFRLVLDMLEAYEVRILVHSVDDPECTKEYVRGFIHGIRALRSDLVAARAYQATKQKAEEIAQTRGEKPAFRYPGSGPGGLS